MMIPVAKPDDRGAEEMTMIKRIDGLPAVLTCFAYRNEYFTELEGMLATVKEHHPNWPIVIGRGPVSGFELPTFEVQSPAGKCQWTFPVALNLDASENDWRKITRMKGWWMAQVWRSFGHIADPDRNRLVWIDSDARLNGPLDIELDSEAEIVAGPWWDDPDNVDDSKICSGLLVFQGMKQGIVETILDQWSNNCQNEVRDLRPSTVFWLDSDQEVLNDVLKALPPSEFGYSWLRLSFDKYCAHATKDGKPAVGALVDQWQMSRKMKFPECRERDWPPPEEVRRQAAREKRTAESSEPIGPVREGR